MRKILLHSSVFVVMSCSKGNFDSGESREKGNRRERMKEREREEWG